MMKKQGKKGYPLMGLSGVPPRYAPYPPPLPPYYPPPVPPRHSRDEPGLLPYPMPPFTYPHPSSREYDPYKYVWYFCV